MSLMKDGMAWFKKQFATQATQALATLPYSLDLLTALAVQETFEVWGNMFKTQKTSDILAACVGDTIDWPSRRTFPKTKADLLSVKNGDQMFKVARDALENVGQYNSSYHKIAASNPNKFCHGFGIFQYDIQFFKTAPAFFLDKAWYDFGKCLDVCLSELKSAQGRAGLGKKKSLSDKEMVYVSIAYNAGSFDPNKGLKQGFKDSSGKYYGELMAQYLALAKTVS